MFLTCIRCSYSILCAVVLMLAANSLVAQPHPDLVAGQVLDARTQKPLGFVSVGVLRHPYGTVADAHGRFTLNLPSSYDADSVRVSLLGYANRTLRVADLRRNGQLALAARPVQLAEARVKAAGLRRLTLGNTTIQATMRIEGFAANTAGNQIGQRLNIKRPAFLEEISFSITDMTYDTVYLRLNVYKLRRDYPAENLLPTATYLNISRQQAKSRVHVNLRRHRLYLTEDVVVAVELVRSPGKGQLWLGCQLVGGGPFYKLEQTPGPADPLNVMPKSAMKTVDLKRKQFNGPWTKFPNIGLGIDATVLELPE